MYKYTYFGDSPNPTFKSLPNVLKYTAGVTVIPLYETDTLH